ncbi:MAG: DoxX family protein [Pseudomonadota bacterium]
MTKFIDLWDRVVSVLNSAGDWAGLLIIRLLMAYEFANAGFRKLDSSDTLWGDVPGWFVRNMANAPFPFAQLPAEFNWFLVTWAEILGGLALVIGLFTRFWAFSLVIVTIVAIFSTHWPADWSSLSELWEGYRITAKDGSGNFRVPLLFLAMLIPLVLIGPGKLSVDKLLSDYFSKK